MSLSVNSPVSGIQAALNILNVSAHNTANINTEGFKKQRATLSEGNNGWVFAAIGENKESGPLYQDADGNVAKASNVDFSEEILHQISAKHLFSANVTALKTSDEMQKSLLDIVA